MSGLILLDRDGVLNALVVDADHGTIDSPLHSDQVEVFSWVPEAIARLTRAGLALRVVSNQPAWAKGKTTREHLEAVHAEVLRRATSAGGVILGSHLCLHRAEDGCDCRKPRTGLLRAALACHPERSPADCWMVGDGVTDLEAGAALGMRTAFLGPRKCDACTILEARGLRPAFWGSDLLEFVEHLQGNS